MSFFVSHPERIYLDADELDRCAGRFDQLSKLTKSDTNRVAYTHAKIVLRLMQVAEFKGYEDFVSDYALTAGLEVEHEQSE